MSKNTAPRARESSQNHSYRIKFFPYTIKNRKTSEQEGDDSPRRFRHVKFFSVIDTTEKLTARKVPASNGNGTKYQIEGGDNDLTVKRAALPKQKLQVESTSPPSLDVQAQIEDMPPSLPNERKQGRLVVEMDAANAASFDSIDDDDDDPHDPMFKRETLPMIVLAGIMKEQNQSKPVMQSEISGAAGDAGIVGVGSVISVVLKYCAVFLIQYGFGPALYGLYTLSSSLVILIASVFNLGLDDAMVRYTAIYRSKQHATSLKGLLIFCTAMAGIAGIVGALLLLVFTPYLVTLWAALKHHSVSRTENTIAQTIPLLQILAPMIPLLTMQMVWFGGLRGFKAFKWRTITTSILQPLLQIVLLLTLLLFFRARVGIEGVALVILISTAFSSILNLYFLFRQLTTVARPEREHYESREWLSFASLNFLTTIIDTVLDSIDTILLAAFGVSNVLLGQYGAAIRISSFILMPLLTLNNIFAPTIAELHSQGESQKLEVMFKVVTKWSITFSLPIFLLTALFSPFLLGVSGPGFIPAWPLVIAFGVGSMINAGTGSVGYMLLMTGHQRLSFLNSIAAVIVNTVLGIILAPRYGAMGIAVSTGLAIVVINLMRLLQVRLLLKMHPYRWDMFKPLGAGLLSAAVIGSIFYLLSSTHIKVSIQLGHSILSVQLLLIPVFLALYIGLVVLFKASPEDEIVMKRIRHKLRINKGKKRN